LVIIRLTTTLKVHLVLTLLLLKRSVKPRHCSLLLLRSKHRSLTASLASHLSAYILCLTTSQSLL
tara:strand:+ start:1346 stop:1540 length:195 start_codon:yes stop_codon:yes gene_type:complete